MNTITVIDASELTTKSFLNNYFYPRIPLVIKNLFTECEINHIKTEDEAIKAFGHLEFECVEEYTSKFMQSNSFNQQPEKWSLRKYLEYIKKEKDTKLCIREFTTPEQIINLFTIPELIQFRKSSEITSNIFVANRNNFAHMHYDGDNRNVLLYQVFGRKRVTLISENYSSALLPVLNQSWLNLSAYSEREKSLFIDMVQGYDFVLEPGDTLFFPMMAWHHLEYTDTGMSINFRFGRNDYNKFLANFVHTDMYVQNISAKFNTQDSPSDYYDHIFNRIRDEVLVLDEDPINKYLHMRKFMKSLHNEFCGSNFDNQYYLIPNDYLIDNNLSLLKIASRPYYFKNWSKAIGISTAVNSLISN